MTDKSKKDYSYSSLTGFHRAVPIILAAIAVFVGLCFITSDIGAIGKAISGLFLGLFSYGAYAIPFLIALHALFYPADLFEKRILSRAIFSVAAIITVSSMIYVVGTWSVDASFNIKDYFSDGILGKGGGFVGSVVGFALKKMFGKWGVAVIATAITAIYVSYFFSGKRGSLSRLGMGLLRGFVSVCAFFERGIKKLIGVGKTRKIEKSNKISREKNRELGEDEFFGVTEGMQSLEISELGISQSRNKEDIEKNPTLHEKVIHRSDETPKAKRTVGFDYAEATKKADLTDALDLTDGVVEKKRTGAPFVTDVFSDFDSDGACESEKDNKRPSSPDDSAESVFTKDFDPFDISIADEMARRPSSKSISTPGGITVSESISEITPEEAERARRLADFERRKKAAINARRSEATPVTTTGEYTGEKKKVEFTEKSDESSGYEPTVAETVSVTISKSEPEATDDKDNGFGGFDFTSGTSSFTRTIHTDDRRADYTYGSDSSGRSVSSEESDVTGGAGLVFEFDSTTDKDLDTESGEKVGAPEYGGKAANPVDYTERDGEYVGKDAQSSDVPTADEPKTILVERTPIGGVSSESYASDSSSYSNGSDEDEDDGAFEPNEGFEGGKSYLSDALDDGEDDEIDLSLGGGNDEDEDANDDEIPPEKQNPIVIGYRGMFSVFSDGDKDENTDSEDGEEGEDCGEGSDIGSGNASGGGANDYTYPDEIDSSAAGEGDEEGEDDNTPPFDIPVAKKPEEKPKETKKAAPDYSDYVKPPIDLLGVDRVHNDDEIQAEIKENTRILIETLESFNVTASIKGVDRGPRITRYEVVPARGVKVNHITNLFDDIALNLAAEGIRMDAPIPGKSAIGFEIPNKHPATVRLRELLECEEFINAKSTTFVAIGKDVAGSPVFGDIAKFPHALVAGATGMGKSVCINSIMISILYKARPDEVKFIMIDPKKVEFKMYSGIPHLLIPVITEAKQAAGALMWAVEEMERRYEFIENLNIRNIEAYNERCAENPKFGKPMPKIVIVIDELNDLMMQVRDPVEDLIMRIAQKARAAGIHLIIGTQRPDVKVITGTIKANINTRISCKVTSVVDSRTILEMAGAEKLLNKGDMLFKPVDKTKPVRVQGAFVSDGEVEAIMNFLKEGASAATYDEEIFAEINKAAQKCGNKKSGGAMDDGQDEDEQCGYYSDQQFLDAVELAIRSGKISTSLLQRKLSIGYGKAAKYIDAMQEIGVVSEPNGQKPRDALITLDEWYEKLSRVSLD